MKDAVSEKKLAIGDVRWATVKGIVGSDLDGVKRTVKLPAQRAVALIKEVRKVLNKSAAQAIPEPCGRLQHVV